MITTLIPQIAAAAATGCIILYAATAKRKVPLNSKDADILWKLHKRDAHCNGNKWQPFPQNHGEITGFRCQCGYRYTQKRPFLSRMPKPQVHVAAVASAGTCRRFGCKP